MSRKDREGPSKREEFREKRRRAALRGRLISIGLIVLGALAVVLQWALERRSATTRYWALLAAMIVMVAAPVVTWFSPWSGDAPAPAVKSGARAWRSRRSSAHALAVTL